VSTAPRKRKRTVEDDEAAYENMRDEEHAERVAEGAALKADDETRWRETGETPAEREKRLSHETQRARRFPTVKLPPVDPERRRAGAKKRKERLAERAERARDRAALAAEEAANLADEAEDAAMAEAEWQDEMGGDDWQSQYDLDGLRGHGRKKPKRGLRGGEPGDCKIVLDGSSKYGATYLLLCGDDEQYGESSGMIETYVDRVPQPKSGKHMRSEAKGLVVGLVDLNRDIRRKGWGTKLYEAAAKEACARRMPLISNDRTTGAFSNDFWRKQHAKGRARIIGERKGIPVYALRCTAKDDLSGVAKKRGKKAPAKYTKSCTLAAYQANVAHGVSKGKSTAQAVAVAISILKTGCGVKSKKRMKPAAIVAQGKKKKR
jgi:GNAT superfamily N-acetyltransferase